MMEHKIQSWMMKQRQSLPLDCKIKLSLGRIKSWYNHFHGRVHVSFSGGKDSTVLLHLVRSMYPDVRAMFVDTGLEYPEIRKFVSTVDNVDWVKPSLTFRQTIKKYGYPVVSKAVSCTVRKLTQLNLDPKYRDKLLYGDEKGTAGKLPEKWKFLLKAPFKISDKCCEELKRKPARKYFRQHGTYAYVGVMAEESNWRKLQYLQYGCNAFDLKEPKSMPLAFWTEQDVLGYIRKFNVPYSSIYGDIVGEEGHFECTGEKRTGCMFCMFGAHIEKQNRFVRMKKNYPNQFRFCMDNLGLRRVCDFVGIET
jgi:3'-phosphoadenosine 5'-phosphosulfate sulfotransferase (PAPS reductase)/FAD synthetase